MAEDNAVVETDLLIGHELGLHARPAALFVQTAQRFQCQVSVARDEQQVNAKSILSILSLAVSQGTTVRVRAEGPDAAEAVAALTQLAADNFGDENV
jgi:phosphotransferase system HPr (HPr) family protein